MVEQFAVGVERRRADDGGQRHQLPIDEFAQPIGLRQAFGVGSGEHVDDPRIGASLLVRDADVGCGAAGYVVHGGFVGECLGADDGGAALGVQRDELQTGLDVAGDVFYRRQTAPRHDLFDVVRLIEGFFDGRIAALPVSDRQMLGDRVIRRDIG